MLLKQKVFKEVISMDFKRMRNLMDSLTDWIIPGNSIVIYKDLKKVLEYSSGFADVENNIKMTGDELLNIYSCSKPVTVTAALQLYEKGLFLLSDPLYEYLPEFKTMYVKDGERIVEAKNKITVRDLFMMTAGFTYDTNTPEIKKARELTAGRMDTRTVVKCMAETPLAFEPSTKWNYSLCHDILAVFVEVVSGKRFSEYVNENIFIPLDMVEACYHTDKTIAPQYNCKTTISGDLVEKQRQGYTGGTIERRDGNSLVFGKEYDSGGAGIITTVSDYAKFAAALANKGTGINGNRILGPNTVELMKTNHLSPELLKYFNWEHLRGYGYGLGVRTMIDKVAGGSNGSIGEFGWGGAAGAMLLMDTSLNLAMFYSHHMLNPQEPYCQPRLRNVLYSCI